jgi:hypothetical protein
MKFPKRIVVTGISPMRRLDADEIARELGGEVALSKKRSYLQYRDPDKRRAYMREYMAKRRSGK